MQLKMGLKILAKVLGFSWNLFVVFKGPWKFFCALHEDVQGIWKVLLIPIVTSVKKSEPPDTPIRKYKQKRSEKKFHNVYGLRNFYQFWASINCPEEQNAAPNDRSVE